MPRKATKRKGKAVKARSAVARSAVASIPLWECHACGGSVSGGICCEACTQWFCFSFAMPQATRADRVLASQPSYMWFCDTCNTGLKNVAKEDMLEMGCDYWAVDYDNPPPQEEARARQNRISRIEKRISKVKCAESLITALPILPAPRAPAMQDANNDGMLLSL